MVSGGGGTVVAAATALIVSFGIAIAAPVERPAGGAADDATARVATAGEATEPPERGSRGGFSEDELLGDLDLAEPSPVDDGAGAEERVVPAVAGQVAGQLDTARGQLAAAVLSRERLGELGLEPINGVDAPPPDRIGTAELVTPFYLLPASERYDPMMGDTGWVSGQVQVLQGSKGRVDIRTWAHAIPAGAALAFEIVQRTPLAVREPSTAVDRGDRARFGAGDEPDVAVLLWTRRDLLVRIEARPGRDGRVMDRAEIERVADAVDRSLDRHPSMRGGRRVDDVERRRAGTRATRATLPVQAVERLGLRVGRRDGATPGGAEPQRLAMAANALDVDPDALRDARVAAAVHQRLVREDPVRAAGTVELRVLAFPSPDDAARGFRTVLANRGSAWRPGGRPGPSARRDYGPARDLLWRRGDLLLHLRVTDRARRASQVRALETRVADAVDRHLRAQAAPGSSGAA